MTIRVETKDFERNDHGYQKYDPQNQPLVCQLDLVRISQSENFLNPTEKDAKVYEKFFEYASELYQHHPEWNSPKYIAERIDLLQLSGYVPEAFKKYAHEIVKPQEKEQTPAQIALQRLKQHQATA
ncbi:MAG: hypothetical protein IJ870_04570 [Alphaproteobacteria bacterium]|nr:hypothetical protein [Alphaproteobacteria bacterium]